MPDERRKLTYEVLQDAVRSAAAFRLRLRLDAVDGDGGKVFPPTYAGGVYAVEDRRVDGKIVRCALLDSVQSQANRMEELLLDAYLPPWRDLNPGKASDVGCDLPVVAVYVENHGWVNTLTAPHRIHDAILRDSEIEDGKSGGGDSAVRFRESKVGTLELVGRNRGEFTLPDLESMRKIVDTAVEHATDTGIEWEAGLLELTPTEKLRELVRASDDLAPVIADEEESVGADSAG